MALEHLGDDFQPSLERRTRPDATTLTGRWRTNRSPGRARRPTVPANPPSPPDRPAGGVHHNGPMTFTNGGSLGSGTADIGLPARRAALPGPADVDVAPWAVASPPCARRTTSSVDQPILRIAVLEKEFAGFGASGRNGGWLTAERLATYYAAAYGWGAAVGMQ